MLFAGKTEWLVLLVLLTCAKAGMIQSFLKTLADNLQTPIQPPTTPTPSQHTANTTLSTRVDGRGYSSYEPHHHHQTHHGYYHQHDQNLDLYGLLAGLSFASLLGAAIIFLASNRTIGRRRRSLEDDTDDAMSHVAGALDDPFWEKDNLQPITLY